MMTPMMGNTLPDGDGVTWAADTGCYANPAAFSPARYLAWLARYQSEADRCLFATMPDVVADAAATLAKIGTWPADLRALGYKPALVAQDGLESLPVPWDDFDALFIGGTTAWKLGNEATALMREARSRGKWVHSGRVNSLRRLRHVAWQGAQSADGTYVAFGPDLNLPKMQGWLAAMERQPMLDLA